MDPKIVELPATTVTGIVGQFISGLAPNSNAAKIIPALWDRFISRKSELAPTEDSVTYGVMTGTSHTDSMNYVAGAPVEPDAATPAGMESVHIPAGRYALYTHTGPVNEYPKTLENVYHKWIPGSGLTMRDAPHVELYDERFDPSSPESEFDVLVPVV